MFAELHRHGHERGEVRRVRLASEDARDLRRRYINFCEGKYEVPREIPCDRMFAENINDVHFLAACSEHVDFASELPASDARVATMSDVLRECQLGAGPYDYTDEGRSEESGVVRAGSSSGARTQKGPHGRAMGGRRATGAVGASCVWRPDEHGLRCTRLNHAVAANHPGVGKLGWKRGKLESGETVL